jgi:protein TonB
MKIKRYGIAFVMALLLYGVLIGVLMWLQVASKMQYKSDEKRQVIYLKYLQTPKQPIQKRVKKRQVKLRTIKKVHKVAQKKPVLKPIKAKKAVEKLEQLVEVEQKKLENVKKSEKEDVIEQSESIVTKDEGVAQSVQHFEQEFVAAIQKAIEANKFYPKIAKRLRKEGVVHVRFWLDTQGNISDIIIEQAPHSSLKKAAIKTLQKTDFPKPPKGLHIAIPIAYKLIKG